MWVRVGVSEGREQVQLICVPQTRVPGKVSCALSGSPGSLGGRGGGAGVGSRGPPGLSLRSRQGLGQRVSSSPQDPGNGSEESFGHPGAYLGRAGVEGASGRGCGRPR